MKPLIGHCFMFAMRPAILMARKTQQKKASTMDRIDAMRLFLRVADAGSFSRAANDLGIGQPTVSRRIQDLEHRLGAELFQRTTRALSLTEAGERFRQRARLILSEFDVAEAEARGLDGEPIGLLRITAAHSLARRVVVPLATRFLDAHPHVEIDLIEDDRVIDLVEEGVDVAFRFGDLPDSSLMARKLGETRRRLWAAPSYLEQHGPPAAPSDLENHTAVLFRHASHGRNWRLERDGERVEVDIAKVTRLKVSSGDSVVRAAVEGAGIALLPDWLVCEDADAGRLVEVLTGWQAEPTALHAVWTGGSKLRGKARMFVDFLADQLELAPPVPCSHQSLLVG